MKLWSRLLPLLLVLALPAAGAALELNDAESGRSVSVPVGETVTVTLAGNPTTGYLWELTGIERTVLTPDAEPGFSADSPLAGSGGRFTFRFAAAAAGTSPVRLVYRRPWEKDVPPLRSFDLTVTVLPAPPALPEGSSKRGAE